MDAPLNVSLFTNNDYSSEDYYSEIKSKTSEILVNAFPTNYTKQQIREEVTGFNIACPYCGDSYKSSSKKRGHLILKNNDYVGFYKCFNCGKSAKLSRFFEDFDRPLTLSGRVYTKEHIESEKKVVNNDAKLLTASVFDKDNALKYGIKRKDLKTMFGLFDIDVSTNSIYAYKYLTNRLQYKFNNFLYDPKGGYVAILNLVDDVVIGMQVRDISGKKGRVRYKTFNLQRLHDDIIKDGVQVPDKLNTLSMLFNIYSINVYQPIIVIEGPMDSFFVKNSIATAGATKNVTLKLPLYYMYDSDKTGNKHAIEKLKEGKHVFLWGKFKRDMDLPAREKWDVNDVMLYLKEKNGYIPKIDWMKYFSNSILDMLYIDKK